MIDLYDPSGKDIFEAKYIDATFDPKTRMYKQKFRPNDENDNRYIFRSYTSMKYLLNEWNENYFLKYTEQNYLYEGLIVSYDIDTACYLLEEFNKTSNLLKDIGVESYGILAGPDKTPYISFFIDEEDYIKTKTDDYMSQKFFELKQLINKMGYFIAQLKEASRPLPDGSKVKSNYCAIHPKFFVEISNAVYNKLDGILYHITLTKNWKKIEQKGFILRNSHANMDEYPDRVFFFTKLPPDDFRATIEQFMMYKTVRID